ncbi:MAG: amidase [Pirellulales bacterium]
MSSENGNPIWTWSATQIASAIKNREIKAIEVVHSSSQRIEQINPDINAVVSSLIDQAEKTAKKIDSDQPNHDNSPLLGVPISIKECFFYEGKPTTVGLDKPVAPQTNDGLPVALLKKAGAIPVAITNVPQLMIIHDTKNPVYGRTRNPWSLEHSVGGSSGGEAASVAAGCSAIGLGSDLGGSIRIPAHFCGVHGLKPTNMRITKQGSFDNLRGMRSVQFQPGPLARHTEDLDLFFQAFQQNSSSWSSGDVAPGEWGDFQKVDVSRLKIGYWEDDQYFTPCPAIRRVVRESVEMLKGTGAEVVALDPPKMLQALKHYFAVVSADGGADFRRLLSGSTPDAEVARIVKLARTPRWLRPALALLLRWRGEAKLAELFLSAGPRSTDAHWQSDYAAEEYRQDYFDQLNQADIDILICPPHAIPAFQHDRAVDLMPAASYAFFFNLLGVPCGTVTCSRVKSGELSDRRPSNDPVFKKAIECEHASAGLPVSVQVAGKPWREDQVLAVMNYLERQFRKQKEYPDITKLPI